MPPRAQHTAANVEPAALAAALAAAAAAAAATAAAAAALEVELLLNELEAVRKLERGSGVAVVVRGGATER